MSVGPTPLEIFRAKGIPHRRMEDWKYTDLRQVLGADEIERESPHEVTMRISAPDSIEYAQSDFDWYQEGLERVERPPNWYERLFEKFPGQSAMEAVARAYDPGSMAMRVPAGTKLSQPLALSFEGGGHRRIGLYIERGASVTLMETHHVTSEGIRNVSLSVFLEEGAQLTHIRESKFSDDLVAVETVSVVQEKSSRYIARFLNGGAKLSRTEVNITLAGEGAEADLSGVSVLGDKAHADITTRIDHAVPNTTSRQLFKKVAGGKSRAVYQGKIIVREGAVGSDSRQTAKALLLSNHAEADLKPELEILADDVKCAHGAAVGDLDADSLFYLRSRGIPESEARGLLIHAFLQEVVDGIEDEGLRGAAVEFIDSGLAWAMESAS
ncbi:MAG TPA: Fe-S cluster assembly protein SufD [Rhizomicrobium sp.]|nr:Fe-S cluster assembly protein SufD [Rhizomicrobium sp.]